MQIREQLVDFKLTPELSRVVKWLINDLDNDGFLRELPEEYARMINTSPFTVIEAIKIIQQYLQMMCLLHT